MAVPRKRRSKSKLSNLKKILKLDYYNCSNCQLISIKRLCKNCLKKKYISDNDKII